MKGEKGSVPQPETRVPQLRELVDVSILQELQDWFSESTGISAMFRDPEGRFITRPVHTNRFCAYVQSSKQGCERCRLSNKSVYGVAAHEKRASDSPVKYVCHTGLTQFAMPIKVGRHYVATLVVGDRPTRPLSSADIERLAREMRLDADKLRRYAAELKPWSDREMRRATKFLHTVAGAIAGMSYQGWLLHKRLAELSSLYETSRLLTSTLDLQEVLNIIVRHITRSVGVHACSIRLLEPNGKELALRAYFNLSRRYVDKGRLILARSVIDREIMKGKIVRIADMTADPRVLYPEQAAREGLRSGIAVPLMGKGRVIGALHLYSAETRDFTREEVSTIRALANLAATAIENARLYRASQEKQALDKELLVARDIQQRLLPRSCPAMPGFDIAAASIPCRQVGGDFYDFIQVDDNQLAFVIADVSGKGVPGAILMAGTRAALRAQVESAPEARPSRVAARLNRVLYRDTSSAQFVSLFYGVLQGSSPDAPQTPNAEVSSLTYTNAGHNPPFLLSAGGTAPRSLREGGMVLGAMPQENYAQAAVTLKKGDLLVFYTDGITDAVGPYAPSRANAEHVRSAALRVTSSPDAVGPYSPPRQSQAHADAADKGHAPRARETFGEARLLKTAEANRKRSAAEVLRAIVAAVKDFTGGAHAGDDRTLVIVKVL